MRYVKFDSIGASQKFCRMKTSLDIDSKFCTDTFETYIYWPIYWLTVARNYGASPLDVNPAFVYGPYERQSFTLSSRVIKFSECQEPAIIIN